MATKKASADGIAIPAMAMSSVRYCIIGITPLILNRLPMKISKELLFPKRKTAGDRANNLKHDPVQEFRDAPDRIHDDTARTLLAMPAVAFKGSMRSAAVDVPGAAKSQIGRLTYMPATKVGIFGTPKLFMSIVRSADINKTPDVRTRCIVERWATEIEIHFVSSIITEPSLRNLLAQAGLTIGVGDWRGEKGSGNYGQFAITAATDPEWEAIIEHGGRATQVDAMERAEPFDRDSAELLGWFADEAQRRGVRVTA